MLIVEGCDNSGKTTLVSRLGGDLRLLTICNRRRPPDLPSSFDYFHRVMPLVQRFETIFDRWQPISEPIYGPICRNVHLFTREQRHAQLIDIHATYGVRPLIIYCRPSLERILDFGEREQMAGVIENAKAIVARYDADMLWLGTIYPVVRYDYEEPGAYDSLKQRALSHLELTRS